MGNHCSSTNQATQSITGSRSAKAIAIDPSEPLRGPLTIHTGHVGPIRPPIANPRVRQISIPKRLHIITHLTLTSHSRSICASLPSVILPNLVTLRIQPGYDENHGGLCHHQYEGPSADGGCCRLIAELRPSRLILGGVTTHTIGSGKGLWSGGIPGSIKELIILIGIFAGNPDATSYQPSLLDHLPSTLDKLTFVLSMASAGNVLPPFPDMDARWNRHYMAQSIFKVCGGLEGGQAVEIVGAENIDSCYPEEDGREDADAGKEHGDYVWYLWKNMARALQEMGCSREEARARRDRVTYSWTRDYQQREDWLEAALNEWDVGTMASKFRCGVPGLRYGGKEGS